jgi:hypothetical protein
MVVLGRGALPYEQGTPVIAQFSLSTPNPHSGPGRRRARLRGIHPSLSLESTLPSPSPLTSSLAAPSLPPSPSPLPPRRPRIRTGPPQGIRRGETGPPQTQSNDVFQETSARYRAVEPEQWLQRHPEAGSSWPSWLKASHQDSPIMGPRRDKSATQGIGPPLGRKGVGPPRECKDTPGGGGRRRASSRKCGFAMHRNKVRLLQIENNMVTICPLP